MSGPALRLVRTDTSPDGVAMAAIARGELGALGTIYDRHAPSLLRFAARVGSPEDAEDLVHDAMLVVAKNAERYDARAASARQWLFGIVGRLAQERRRGFVRRTKALLGLMHGDQLARAPTRDGDLDKGLARLSAAKRVVLIMAEVEGFSCEEIASALQVPIGTIWTRLHHARRELRAFFGESK